MTAGSTKNARIALLEKFLREHQKSGKQFTKLQISEYTGYPVATISTYFAKYLVNYLVHAAKNKKYSSGGIEKLSSKEFQNHLSQKSSKLTEAVTDQNVKKLQQRSLDAFCLAIENYNRLMLRNRVEIFCILMSNAWELLLKFRLVETSGIELSNSARVKPAKYV